MFDQGWIPWFDETTTGMLSEEPRLVDRAGVHVIAKQLPYVDFFVNRVQAVALRMLADRTRGNTSPGRTIPFHT